MTFGKAVKQPVTKNGIPLFCKASVCVGNKRLLSKFITLVPHVVIEI
jgi:hypothetical protein